MNDLIPIIIAIEDTISENVTKKILNQSQNKFDIRNSLGNSGCGYLKNNIRAFNESARGIAFLVLTDLDTVECPPLLIRSWLPNKNPNMLFRVAVREVEAWLLAHRDMMASFLGVETRRIPHDTDSIADPKGLIVELARKSRKVDIRKSIVPSNQSTAKVGPDYNSQLIKFIWNQWDINSAIEHSSSLKKTVDSINRFKPKFTKCRYT